MPETERTDFSTPIPLRDNGTDERPNPYSRLEAANAVLGRLRMLEGLQDEVRAAPDGLALGAIVIALAQDLRAALRGDLAAVEGVLASDHGLTQWTREVDALLWPARARLWSTAQADAEDEVQERRIREG